MLRELKIEENAPFKKTNLWGGALALGHPLGEAQNPELQLLVLRDALGLLQQDLEPGSVVVRSYPRSG